VRPADLDASLTMDGFSDSDFLRGLSDGMSVVRRWVQRNEIVAEYSDDERECAMQFGSDSADLLVRIVLDKDTDASLSVFVHPDFEVPDERRAVVLETCNLLNVAMLLGNVEFDPDERRVRYRYLLAYPSGQLDAELFEGVFDGCLDSANRSVKALMGVTTGKLTPSEALASLSDTE
jgi:hypothetical protein